jgi:hypothetical protein
MLYYLAPPFNTTEAVDPDEVVYIEKSLLKDGYLVQ